MKIICILLIATIFSACATSNISGLYVTQDCGEYDVDCFKYYFKSDGRYTYWYSNSTIGEITLYGNYYIFENLVKLTPNQYIYHDSTRIEYIEHKNPNKTIIKINLIPGYLKNKPDTMHVPWLIKINNDYDYDETDEEGVYETQITDIKKIEIKDYSAKFDLDSSAKVTEAILIPKKNNCDLNINLASEILEPIVIPPVKKFRIKGKKLFAINENDSCDEIANQFKASTSIYIKEKD